MNTSNVRLTIPARAEYLDIVRLTLYGIATKAGFSFEEIEDMKVAVAEACNNAILHAYKGVGEGSVELSFEMEEHGMTIRVKDEGSSFDYEHSAHLVTSLHERPLQEVEVGGLGIFMMQALMDQVQVLTDRGTEVILTKRFSRNEGMA
ncbi:anti-sigma B factor RsbW [Paenibacillus koleovorans]|uniref:anti-sigma B factor RsbW n=1 Tax=Paenibacillus koleovorans TaxID=121608 RepID=UPI000FDAAD83|nr:anti-sigma B factor RsbW [Paenibacillus koleovorans]